MSSANARDEELPDEEREVPFATFTARGEPQEAIVVRRRPFPEPIIEDTASPDDHEADEERDSQAVSPDAIRGAITGMVARFQAELFAKSQQEVSADWYFAYDASRSLEWNVYRFSEALELHRRQARQWEEHHHGSACVVERVRDTYLMPRVQEFTDALRRALARAE